MATWTDIANSRLEPGKPARSIDALALRDNPIAITEGADGAPRNQTGSYADGSVTNPKIASVAWGKVTGRPALGAYYSTGEYAISVGASSAYRVPNGYVMTGIATNAFPSVVTIYARGLAV